MANSKDVVVTGVSSGIGLGTAKVLVSKGFRVFGLCASRQTPIACKESSETASCLSSWTLVTLTLYIKLPRRSAP